MALSKRLAILAFYLLSRQSDVLGLIRGPLPWNNCRLGGKCQSPIALKSSVAESVGYLRDNLQTPPEALIKAVERAGPNTPLSVGDAAAFSGTDLNAARKNLMILAALTGGNLEVTQDGEILYSFPSGVRSVLERRSLGQKVKVQYNFLYPYLLYALRASFGILLFSSLAVLIGTFVAVSSSSSSSNSDERDRGSNRGYSRGPTLDLPYMLRGSLDPFYYRPYYGVYQNPNYRPDYTQASNSAPATVSFIESFFSYVFGDGDPNVEFPNEQLKCMAAKIRANGGMVVADQLGPYLDPPAFILPSKKEYDGTSNSVDTYIVDESWVLPAVLQLGGVPVVTDEGNIVYQFQVLVSAQF